MTRLLYHFRNRAARPPLRRAGRALAGILVLGASSSVLAACGSSTSSIKLSVSSGTVGSTVDVSGNAGAGCAVDKNWFGFDFKPAGGAAGGPATQMTTLVSKGTWSATFAVPKYLGEPGKGAGVAVTPGRYQFSAPGCTNKKVAVKTFTVKAGSPAGNAYVAIVATVDGQGYWLARADGQVSAYGDAHGYGSVAGHLASPIVAMARTYSGHGYWLVGAGGHVYTFGDAHAYGSAPATLSGGAAITSIAATPNGRGYYLLGANGHIYAFGDAHVDGQPTAQLAPYDAIGARPAGGYVVTAADDAGVYVYPGGSLASGGPGNALAASLVGTAVSPSGNGVWQAGMDGGVITWGDSAPLGSVPGEGVVLKAPVSAIAATPDGRGYWLLGADGTIYNFGDASFFGPGPKTK